MRLRLIQKLNFQVPFQMLITKTMIGLNIVWRKMLYSAMLVAYSQIHQGITKKHLQLLGLKTGKKQVLFVLSTEFDIANQNILICY